MVITKLEAQETFSRLDQTVTKLDQALGKIPAEVSENVNHQVVVNMTNVAGMTQEMSKSISNTLTNLIREAVKKCLK